MRLLRSVIFVVLPFVVATTAQAAPAQPGPATPAASMAAQRSARLADQAVAKAARRARELRRRPIFPPSILISADEVARTAQIAYGLTGAGVGVAVIDSGISSWHDETAPTTTDSTTTASTPTVTDSTTTTTSEPVTTVTVEGGLL